MYVASFRLVFYLSCWKPVKVTNIMIRAARIVHPYLKGVRYDLETHLRVIKISVLTIVGSLSSKIESLNRYNLWFIIYKLCENDGFLLKKDGFSYIYVLELRPISKK